MSRQTIKTIKAHDSRTNEPDGLQACEVVEVKADLAYAVGSTSHA